MSNIHSVFKTEIHKNKYLLSEESLNYIKTASQFALAVIAITGALTLTAVAPNLFTAIDSIFLKNKRRDYTRKEKLKLCSQTLYYLKKSGYIKVNRQKPGVGIILTKLGVRQIKKANFDSLSIPKPKHWGGTWWLTAADIPTKTHKKAADMLRWKLKTLGFYPLQRTLWIHPHDPTKALQEVIDHYQVNRFVTLMHIDRLDQDDEQKLKDHFKKRGII